MKASFSPNVRFRNKEWAQTCDTSSKGKSYLAQEGTQRVGARLAAALLQTRF